MQKEQANIMAGKDKDHYPLTSPQAAIWLDLAKGRDPVQYNICNVIEFGGTLDIDLLRRSIVQCDGENDALRLHFSSHQGEVTQFFVDECRPTDFGVIDLRSEDDPKAAAFLEAKALKTQPLAFEVGENCRHQVLQLSDDLFWWVRVYHHLVCDGYAGHLIAERTASIYNALSAKTDIPECPFHSYRAFVEADSSYSDGPAYQNDLVYWRERLTPDRPPSTFSAYPVGEAQKSAQFTDTLDDATLKSLQSVSRACGMSATAMTTSLFAILLGRITHQNHPVWNMPMLNRLGKAERNTPGTFTCVAPYDTNLSKHKSISELGKNIFATSRRDVRHARITPLRLRMASIGAKSLSASGANFNSLDSATPIVFSGLLTRRINIQVGPANDLSLAFFSEAISPTQSRAELIWQFDANRIDEPAVRQIADQFEQLLKAVLANPDQDIAALGNLVTIDQESLGLNKNTPNSEKLSASAHEVPVLASEDEKQLATDITRIWTGLIQNDDIGPDDNLIEAGAHSLLLPRAQYALSRLVGYDLSLLEIFEHPTINGLTRYICGTFPNVKVTLANNGQGLDGAPDTNTVVGTHQSTPEPIAQDRQQIVAEITRIWAVLLENDHIGPNENLIEAGSHSLLLPRLQYELSKLFGIDMSLLEIAECASINALADRIRETCPNFKTVRENAITNTPLSEETSVPVRSLPKEIPVIWQNGLHILPFSAPTRSELDEITAHASAQLSCDGSTNQLTLLATELAAATAYRERAVILAHDTASAIDALTSNHSPMRIDASLSGDPIETLLLFPGQGSQRPGMARALFDADPESAELINRACKEVIGFSGPIDLRDLLLSTAPMPAETEQLANTDYAQPALFIFEYALATWLMRYGVTPSGLAGHSIGEYVAACIAGVMSFEDALRLVVMRGKLMRQTAPGAMYALSMPEDDVTDILTHFGSKLSLAAKNGPRQHVVAGDIASIDRLESHLKATGKSGRRLVVSRAFHSDLMDPILAAFRDEVATVSLHAPNIPIQSNLTGKWLTDEDATNPDYWVRHLRHGVRFSDNIHSLLSSAPTGLFIECGPGQTATRLAAVNGVKAEHCIALQSASPPESTLEKTHQGQDALAHGLATIWAHGAQLVFSSETTGSAEPQQQPAQPSNDEEDLKPGPIVSAFPAHPAVEGQWLARRDQPADNSHHIIVSFRLPQNTDFKDAKRAIEQVIERHDALRSTFNEYQGQLQHRVHATMPVSVRELDRVEDIRIGLFDLRNGPLARVGYVAQNSSHPPILALAIDHMCFDGQSTPTLELAFLDALNGIEKPRPETAQSIARRGHEDLAGNRGQTGKHFWKERSELLLEAPVPGGSDATHPGRSTRLFKKLSSQQVDAFTTLSRHIKTATPTAIWNALILAVIARHKEHGVAVLGQPFSGRHGPDNQQIIGCFANVLPIAIKVDLQAGFDVLVGTVAREILSMLDIQDYPLSRLIKDLSQMAKAPVDLPFDAVSTIEINEDIDDINDIDFGAGKFPLMVTLLKCGAGTFIAIEYKTSIYGPHWAERFAERLLSFLGSLAIEPDKPLGQIDILPNDERQFLIEDLNATHSQYPRDTGLGELLALRIQDPACANRIAISDGETKISYRDLGMLLSEIATKLDEIGVQPGQTVALATERNTDAIIAILGLVWHGNAYLPIDKSLPINAIADLMEECGANTLLCSPHEQDRLTELAARFNVAPLPTVQANGATAKFKCPAKRSGDDLAYVMFTSGSTGKPKGVLVPNRAVARLVLNNPALPFEDSDVVAQAASLGFDAATLEIWAPLLNGGRLHILDNEALFNLSTLSTTLADAGVTTMWMTASLFNLIADETPESFKSLKRLMSGGEALSPAHLRKVRAACPDVMLINGYGPTENTTFTCTHLITENDLRTGHIPIGKPIGNTRIYVVDGEGQLALIDVWGELYAAGDGLALGYTGAPERTEKSFVKIDGINEERLYKTGDRVRWRQDGTIEFGGRRDGQVKIRGHRIELTAIEQKLSSLAGIRNVCVLPIGAGADAFLGAAIAADHDDRDAWAATLARDFPDYMVPERFVVFPHLPVNANGKVDRKNLQAAIAQADHVRAVEKTQSTASEDLIAGHFETLFPGKEITPSSDFFALGGHSLLAMRLAGMIETQTGQRPKIQDIFTARTVANIATLVGDGKHAPAQEILPRTKADRFALSSGQARLWVLQRMQPELAVYSVPITFELTGKVDVSALQRALHHLEDRQHALRLRFTSDPDHPDGVVQVLAPSGSWVLRHHHMDEATANNFVAAETARPFDLEDQPLARADLITLGPDHHLLMISLHHAICDGWSMPILLGELTAFYQTELSGNTPSLHPITHHYEDFVSWQRAYLAKDAGKAALTRCKDRLLPLAEPLNLPTDYPRPAERRFAGDFQAVTFSNTTSQLIDQAAERYGTTAFSILTALTQVLLYRHCGQTDIPMGMLVAGRDNASLDNVIGFFVNTVVLRQKVDPDALFDAHLTTTTKTIMQALSDQAVPFEDVVNAVNAPRDLSRNPLFDVLVAWQDDMPEIRTFGDMEISLRETEFPFAKFDLGFYFFRKNAKLSGHIEFDTALFDRATIVAFVKRLETLCHAALSGMVNAPLSALSILPDAERAQIDQFNATQKHLPIDRSISEPFLDQVAATPDTIAVRDDTDALSYQQFARRAAGIAEILRGKSIKPGDVVGVAVRRSVNMLAAIHGILLAGAAYSPLDPDHPEQRRKDMLDDLGDGFVITTPDLTDLFNPAKTIVLDGNEDADVPALTSGPDDLAYVLFTSGSTGRPKGVEIAHRGVLNRILWMQDAFPLGPDDVILQKTPITFDVSVWELFWWSWTGAQVVLPAPGAERDPLQIADAICQNRVTTMHFVPSMLATFLFAIESGMVDIEKLATLRRIFASGEALDAAVVQRFNALLFDKFGTELHNLYGPTEATVDVTWQACSPHHTGSVVPIGKPIANTTIQILSGDFKPLPIGVAGEIILGGPQIALRYRNRPELSAEKFPNDPTSPGSRLYRTGDLGRWRRDGTVEYLGRIDHQVKIRGYRIECGEVEAALESHPNVERAPIKAVKVAGLDELHAFVLGTPDLDIATLREHLRKCLPEYMIPARFFAIEQLPLTSSGKVDRKALAGKPIRANLAKSTAPAKSAAQPAQKTHAATRTIEADITRLWAEVLPDVTPTRDDGFFDVGGNSLLLLRLFEKIEARWPGKIAIVDLFANPSIAGQADLLTRDANIPTDSGLTKSESAILANDEPIAVIGMALQVAGADTPEKFWTDIAAGRDLVRPLPAAREADARELYSAIGKPVPTRFREVAYLDTLFEFDAQRFRLAPIDAGLLDPEQRLFIETALMAMENAGYGGNALKGQKVGVFAGGGTNPVWRMAMDRIPPAKAEQAFALNVPSNIVTRLSFLKDWHGPANVIDTACSSSLVAVHHACQNLRNGSCTVAIAGGAKLLPCPPDAENGFTIDSSTARTRAFDAGADGTGMGEGSVIFVLKPLSNALKDGDPIHAIIRGSAVNQDGTSSGAAAPNPVMQAEVIKDAARSADIDLASVSYFEAHGTGTSLGDPIEIDGLTRAFAGISGQKAPAFIGSGKGNYGHLDGTAGALGLARAIMALRHDQAPPQPYFETPNPKINFDRAPVQVAQKRAKLPNQGTARRAGISSFGLSGINAHIVIETAPERTNRPQSEFKPDTAFVFAMSAGSTDALRQYAANLHHRISNDPSLPLCDIALTLASGRDVLKHRFAFAAQTRTELLDHLLGLATGIETPSIAKTATDANCEVVLKNATTAQMQIDRYLNGGNLLWPADTKARRVSLPPTPFVRKTCKPVFETRPQNASQGILQGPVETPTARVFSIAINDPAFWPLHEHKLNGHPTLVGMAVPALMAKAAASLSSAPNQPICLSNLVWHSALVENSLPDGKVTLSFDDDGKVELAGRLKNGTWRVFASATWQAAPAITMAPTSSLADIRLRTINSVPDLSFSNQFGAINVSDRWDCTLSLQFDSTETVALKHLQLKPAYLHDINDWLLHPALGDVACSMPLMKLGTGYVPVGIDQITLHGIPTGDVYACSEERADGIFEIALYDVKTSQLVLLATGVNFVKTGQAQTQGRPELLATVWQKSPLPAAPIPSDSLFISNTDFWPLPDGCKHIHPNALSKDDLATRSHAVLALSADENSARRTADTLRTILHNMQGRLRLVVVGSGAFTIASDPITPNPDQSAVAGLILAIAKEEPQLDISFVDLPAHEALEHLGAELSNSAAQDPVAVYRNGARHVRDLAAPVIDPKSPADTWPDHGVCVVTGGTGGFAMALAKEFAANGKVQLALLGRRGETMLDDATKSEIAVLRDRGITLSVLPCDITDRALLSTTLDDIRNRMGPITAIVHAAGIADGGFLARRDMADFDAVLAAKIIGARNLDQLTRDDPLEAFVMFGSLTAISGAPGQTAYCAANAFLDGLAHYRAANIRPALTIDWCALSEQGMAARHKVRLEDGSWISPKDAIPLWRSAISHATAQLTVLDPAVLRKAPSSVANSNDIAAASKTQTKVDAPNAQTASEIIASIWAETLGYEHISHDDDFFALGGDSITGMQIVDRVNNDLGVSLTISDLFSAPNIASIVELADFQPTSIAPTTTALTHTSIDVSDPKTTICKIWAETLGYDAVEPDDDFYALGGDSITGMQIIDRMTSELGHNLTLTDLFEHSSVEKLAQKLHLTSKPAIGLNEASSHFTPEPKIAPTGPTDDPRRAPTLDRYPLAAEQISVLNAAQKGNMGTAFNLPHAYILSPQFDIDKLATAIKKLTERYDLLRTRIISDSTTESWQMEILPVDQALPDLTVRSVAGSLEDASTALVAPFDLDTEFPVRWALLQDKFGKTLLFFDIHHVLADGFTTERLLGELFGLYTGTELPPLKYQLQDYAWWSQTDDSRQRLAAARNYWQSLYADHLPKLDLPSNRPRPAYHTFNGEITSFAVDAELLGNARKFAASNRVTMFTLVMATWFTVLGRMAKTDDLVISVPVSARDAGGFRDLAGMMVSLLPLRMHLDDDETVSNLLARMQEHHVSAMRHRAYFLDQLLDDLTPPASPDRTLLSEVSLSYMNYEATTHAAGLNDQAPQPVIVDRHHCKNDLGIFIRDLPGKMTVAFDYYADMFDRASIDALGQVFAATLERLIQSGAQTIGGIDLLSGTPIEALKHWHHDTVKPAVSAEVSSTQSAEPSGTEIVVADIFTEVFKKPISDPATSFVTLGGHSLLAIRIVNRLADKTGTRISMADFFATPTIAGLAILIDQTLTTDTTTQNTTIPSAPELDLYPASHAQKRLYLLSQMAGDTGAYGMLFVLRCSGSLQRPILESALRNLVDRHEPLRTAFEEHDGVIKQRVHPTSTPDIINSDVSALADPAREALRLTREEAAKPVKLDQPPLIRAHMIKITDDECLLLIATHHIVGDGWSSRILTHELGVLYQAALTQTSPDLAALPITYKDFAHWQSQQDWTDTANYWREKLKNAPDQIMLPTDYQAPAVQSYRGAHAHMMIDDDVLRGLHALARAHKATLSSVGMALFSAMLYRLTRQDDMVIGMGVAGREKTETEGLIGFFVNVLPIRVKLDADTELDTLIDEIHRDVTAALDRQDYPFDELVRAVAPKRNANRQPLVNVVFEYQRFGALTNTDDTSGGMPIANADHDSLLPDNMDAFVDNTTAKHDVILFLTEDGDQARFTLEYDTDLFGAETMQKWLGFLTKFAAAAAQNHTNKNAQRDA